MSRGKLPKGRPGRRRARRKRMLIECNGELTETGYFKHLLGELGISSSLVMVDNGEKGRDPVALVRGAAKRAEADRREAKRESYDPYAYVWAVTDSDYFENLAQAQKEARGKGVQLAITNPCFEVWLIDHMKECPDSCSDTAACKKAAVQMDLVVSPDPKRESTGKKKLVNYGKIEGLLDSAMTNAVIHNTDGKRHIRTNNPENKEAYAVWTDIPAVIDQLRGLQSKQAPTPPSPCTSG